MSWCGLAWLSPRNQRAFLFKQGYDQTWTMRLDLTRHLRAPRGAATRGTRMGQILYFLCSTIQCFSVNVVL